MEEEIIRQSGVEIEREWDRVRNLLARKDEPAWSLAVVEARKIFGEVLEDMSWGMNDEEKLQNASEVFRDFKGLLRAEKIYQHILTQLGHRTAREIAVGASEAYMQAILDMVGRDAREQSWWHRLLNGQNLFWGHHPRLIVNLLLGILGFVVVVWFLADTEVGQWIVRTGVGFARFVMGWQALLVGLVIALALAMGLSLMWRERGRRDR